MIYHNIFTYRSAGSMILPQDFLLKINTNCGSFPSAGSLCQNRSHVFSMKIIWGFPFEFHGLAWHKLKLRRDRGVAYLCSIAN
jgi:hypothetical protein